MSKISNPTSTSEPLSGEALGHYVKDVLEPIINKFEKDNRGKEITQSDIEKLYENLDDNLWKDPRIINKSSRNREMLGEMAGNIANEIQQGHKVSTRDKLIRGFSDYCSNHGLKAIGTACLKLIKKDTNLISQLDRIAKEVKSTKTIYKEVGNSESAKKSQPIAKPKIGGDRAR